MNNWVKKLIADRRIEMGVRWVVGMPFVLASYHKIISPEHFAKIIYGYYLFPDFSINIIAIVLPFLELFAGFALIFGIYPRSAALIVNGMLVSFIIALSINLVRGKKFDCGCFSFGEAGYEYTAGQMLIRDVVFLVLGLYVMCYEGRRQWCLRQTGGIFKNMASIGFDKKADTG